MKRIRLDRWASQIQPPRNPRLPTHPSSAYSTRGVVPKTSPTPSNRQTYTCRAQWHPQARGPTSGSRHMASSTATAAVEQGFGDEDPLFLEEPYPAASESRAGSSAKLAALHARLALPAKLPLATLARCLVDASVDPRPGSNNSPLAILGQELLGYYTAEWLICHYPRLPMPVLFAAQYAYVGGKTLATLRRDWGVEPAVAPGLEVDAGLLQFVGKEGWKEQMENQMRRAKDEISPADDRTKTIGTGRTNEEWNYRRGISSRIVYDNEFGDLLEGRSTDSASAISAPITVPSDDEAAVSQQAQRQPSPITHSTIRTTQTTVEDASATFVRALTGALYLHAGLAATQNFHNAHILSRQLPLHTLFNFTHPTRDLSRLCLREGFEPPVARMLSETGRHSRTPVFVVGVFSGDDKLGEGAGSSLNEARVRAAAAALRAWYLYSPPEEEIKVPSWMLGSASGPDSTERKMKWRGQLVDVGEIIT